VLTGIQQHEQKSHPSYENLLAKALSCQFTHYRVWLCNAIAKQLHLVRYIRIHISVSMPKSCIRRRTTSLSQSKRNYYENRKINYKYINPPEVELKV
jgi:hypothetical protein